MRRVIVRCSIALFVVFIVLAGHWTVAQDAESADGTVTPSHEARERDVADEDEDYHEDYDENHSDDEEGHDEEYGEEEYDEDDCDEDYEHELLAYELRNAECEYAQRLVEVSQTKSDIAAWVISEIHAFLDDEEAAKFLQQLLHEVEDPVVERLIRLKLADLLTELDQAEQVKQQLRRLILGS